MKSIRYIFITLICLTAVWIPVAGVLSGYLVVERPLDQADVILLLSGGAEYRQRAAEAAMLYQKGVAPKILLTNDGVRGGWDQVQQRNPYFVELAISELVTSGVPMDCIEVLPNVVEGTIEEANLVLDFTAGRGIKSILLVTSAFHSRRAVWSFERAISKNDVSIVIGVKSPVSDSYRPPASYWWFSRDGWQIVVAEYAKTAYYWLYHL